MICFFSIIDGVHGAICLAGTAFHTYFRVNVGLGFAFRNGFAWAARHAGSAEDTLTGNDIGHAIILSEEPIPYTFLWDRFVRV